MDKNPKKDLFSPNKTEMRMEFVADLVAYLREKYGDEACDSTVMSESLFMTSLVLSGRLSTLNTFRTDF
ncbi:hypothetical protein LV777_10310 [Providencia rettgeri]|uniref:hypothetical protein n=1 Tax=Providencia rettgeri TaxID=587 RepID=UPI00204B8CA5|nr:hypothetical protein [Providencia rettgeri]UPQ37736.1 hypothetical protein LV777_10310 [Providencia rettgeri]